MEYLILVVKELEKLLPNIEVYAVGGCVRDAVMGITPKDFDFCGPSSADDIESLAKSAGRRVFTTGKRFGTVSFKVKVGDKYELIEYTTYRSEVYTNKSRKPEVEFVTSLDEDLARRDFTMNAMVLRSDGSIYDPYGGRLDIYAKQIKTVGTPKDRIIEDPLRIFRAARFAARYNFSIDPNFIGKARQLADRIYDVSVERWVQELDKMLTSDYTYIGVDYLHKMGTLARILPELYIDVDEEINKDEIVYINPFDCCGDDITVYGNPGTAWKFLLDNIHTPHTIKEDSRAIRYINSGICARLKFSNDRTDLILDKQNKKE